MEVENKRLIDIFLQLIKISSPTGEVKDFQDFLNDFFVKYGFEGGLDGYDNLIFRTKVFDPKKSLLLTTHIDTVSPGKNIKPKIDGEYIVTDGTTILGADPKSGIAAIMFLIEKFAGENRDLENLELVFSTNEEEGDHTLAYADVLSKKAIVLDNAAEIKKILYKSPNANVFEVNVEGREVYAQIDYDKGANAITTLAKIVNEIDWGFYKDGCVANTGTIHGGKATTMVAKNAFLKGNVYCFEKKDVEMFVNRLRDIANEADVKFGTKTKIEIVERYVAAIADKDGELVSKLKKSYLANDVKVELEKQLLISSNNCLAEKNIESVNVGLGYYGCHTKEERLSIPQFEKFTEILEYIMSDFNLIK